MARFCCIPSSHNKKGERGSMHLLYVNVMTCGDLWAGKQFVLLHIIAFYMHTYPRPRMWPATEY